MFWFAGLARLFRVSVTAVLVGSAIAGQAASVPPAEKLLPPDTLVVLTAPNWPKAKASFEKSPAGQLWRDDAMKPFREKNFENVQSRNFLPFDRDFGLHESNSLALAQGQATLALIQHGTEGPNEPPPTILFVMDAKEKSAQLRTNLAELKQTWLKAGRPLKTEKIRGVEFTALATLTASNAPATPPTNAPPSARTRGGELAGIHQDAVPDAPRQWFVGQTDSLLIAGTSTNDLAQMLARLSGGSTPSLAEQPNFARSRAALDPEAHAFGWVNVKRIGDTLAMRLAALTGANVNTDPNAPRLDKLLRALGLAGFDSLAFSARDTGDGTLLRAQLDVPQAQRQGVFKMLATEAKASDPPPVVPSDAVKFGRWRLDLQQSWTGLTNTLTEIFPAAGSVIRLLLDYAGKDLDLAFDARTNLLGNLGDDVISFELSPRTNTLAALKSPPRITLVGARDAAQFAASLRAVTSVLPADSTRYKEREFLGRKVYSITVPDVFQPDAPPLFANLNYTALSNYVVFANDAVALEEYLRGAATNFTALRAMPGLNEAAQKVGGMGTGWFGFENQRQSLRTTLDVLRQEPGWLAERVNSVPLASAFGLGELAAQFQRNFDFSLLPPSEKISKHFQFMVYAGNVTPEGFGFKIFFPAPPADRK